MRNERGIGGSRSLEQGMTLREERTKNHGQGRRPLLNSLNTFVSFPLTIDYTDTTMENILSSHGATLVSLHRLSPRFPLRSRRLIGKTTLEYTACKKNVPNNDVSIEDYYRLITG
jgi:hypothetical protein